MRRSSARSSLPELQPDLTQHRPGRQPLTGPVLFQILPVLFGMLAFGPVAMAAPKQAAAAVVVSPVAAAQTCYGQADYGCVVRLLETAVVPEGERSEQLRLLALAASRLDRHDLARQAFADWIRRDRRHRLDKNAVPPGVWQDYAAALVTVLGSELERTPQLTVDPTVPPVRPTARDLPRAPLPALSSRDRARDFRFVAGLHGSWVPGQAAVSPLDHLGGLLGIEIEAHKRVWIGARLAGLRFGLDRVGSVTAPVAQARAVVAVGDVASPWFHVAAGGGAVVGGATDQTGPAALHVAVRYAPAAAGAVGWALECSDDVLLGASAGGPHHVVSLGLVAVLRNPPKR